MTLMTRLFRRATLREGNRCLELVLVGLGVPVFVPLVGLCAAAIWIADRQSPFFVQERLGRYRLPLRVLKLRTMSDGRVTPIGRWLRPTGLDELPQFWNVIRGDMALVGPRPLTERDADRLARFDDEFGERFRVKPGITGLAQVLGGRGPRHCAKLERLYARRRTACSDLALVCLSLCINLTGRRRVRRWLRAPIFRRQEQS